MPVPRLGPGPCSALGAHKPTGICAQGCWGTRQRVSALKSSAGNSPGSVTAKPSTLYKTRLLCQGCTNSKGSAHPQSKPDRQERSGATAVHSGLQSWLYLVDFSSAHCLPAEHTTIQPTAQKHTLRGALTSTNSCL